MSVEMDLWIERQIDILFQMLEPGRREWAEKNARSALRDVLIRCRDQARIEQIDKTLGLISEFDRDPQEALQIVSAGLDEERFYLTRKPSYMPLQLEAVPGVEQHLRLQRDGIDLRALLYEIENALIAQATRYSGHNINKAATILGLNRTTLVEKIKRRERVMREKNGVTQ